VEGGWGESGGEVGGGGKGNEKWMTGTVNPST